jgi:general secretion pathway protein I
VPTPPRFKRGFTLLEVIVALMVIAVALGAVLAAAGQSARSSAHIRDKTLALWVASNLTAEVHLNDVPEIGEVRGADRMGGRVWHWRRVTSATDDVHIVRIQVSVFERELDIRPDRVHAPVVELNAFMSRHRAPGPPR